ncbi:hypothetical protein CKA32_001951 [Geitlerinema sp. FC II]|nr:hypothetical protein CKA32_001951 [Geitlerinema sp. FC II]
MKEFVHSLLGTISLYFNSIQEVRLAIAFCHLTAQFDGNVF